MKHYKTGRWSKDELKFVRENATTMSIEQLSEKLNRPVAKIAELVGQGSLSEDGLETNIRNTHEWKQIVQQLDTDEQETFLYHWREIINQFKSDITHTEKLQMMDLIRSEILMNRVMKRMYLSQEILANLQEQLQDEKSKPPELRDVVKIDRYNQDITNCFVAVSNFQKENQLLMERKQQILKEMKATRAERKKKFEDSKETLKDWVVTLITNPEVRKNLGEEIEKYRLAMEVEYKHLSDYHQYMDGTLEQPILNSENVKDDNI